MAYGLINADQIGTSVANTSLGAGDASLMKNRIINGAMTISQYNGTSSVTPSTTNTYPIDRWQYNASQSSKFAIQQNGGAVTPPVGFINYLGCTSQSAYSVGASESFVLQQSIEGLNVYDLGWGSANAKTVTLSFWVYSSLTGTFGGALANNGNTRCYPFSYSIPVANTWTQISITIAGDTTGTWTTDNSAGIKLRFSLGAGATVSGTAGSWSGTNYYSATGAVSVVGTNGATFYITGVQLEVGSSATGYEYRMYQQELALCQRYAYKLTSDFVGITVTTSGLGGAFYFPVTMRATPAGSSGSFSMSGGNAGTYAEANGTPRGIQIYNSANNWTVPANCNVTVTYSAEL